MFSFLFVLTTTAVAIANGLPAVQRFDGRIVGGKDASIENFPYQISLRVLYGESALHNCGGSIYSSRVVICAAHCLSGYKPSSLGVVVGSSILIEDSSANVLKVEKTIINPEYNSLDNDVGIIILAEPLIYSETVQPIGLVKELPLPGSDAVISGWGSTMEGGNVSDKLQEVTVQIVSNDVCADNYSPLYDITDSMICAGVEKGGKDACQGDSGGPLAVNGELAGIVSWGLGCARAGYPGVYSSVAKLRPWIEENAEPYL